MQAIFLRHSHGRRAAANTGAVCEQVLGAVHHAVEPCCFYCVPLVLLPRPTSQQIVHCLVQLMVLYWVGCWAVSMC